MDVSRQKLANPEYRRLHFAAISAIATTGRPSWYDSRFLARFEAAKRYLALVQPTELATFIQAFEPLRTNIDFKPVALKGLFSKDVFAEISSIVASLEREKLEHHELKDFGRHILHNHPAFVDLQSELAPMVSERVGEALCPSYNFVSLYNGDGSCEVHLDEPEAKFTLDICIDSNVDWPIFFSEVVDWPLAETWQNWRSDALISSREHTFSEQIIAPNDAIIFSGSAQWHFRKPISLGGYCNLLFFHFRPCDTDDLIDPRKWSSFFDIPELEVLIDAMEEPKGLD